MFGAIVFLMAAWLSFDAYRLRSDVFILFRTIGFSSCSLWYVFSVLTVGNDLLSFLSVTFLFVGLLAILFSFLKKNELLMHSVIVIPSYSLLSNNLFAVSAILAFIISYLSFRQWKIERNPTWKPFSYSFFLLAISSAAHALVVYGDQVSFFAVAYIFIELVAFIFLGYWIWQYMRLRINESIMMLSVGLTFFLAVVVTLVFSTILIGRVTFETSRNLITDVKILDFAITTMEETSLAKVDLVSKEDDIVTALSSRDFSTLDLLSENFLQKYNLGYLIITDAEGDVLVRAHDLSVRGDSVSTERVFEEVLRKNAFVTIAHSDNEGFSIRAGSPVLEKGEVIGSIIAGYQLDNAFVDRMKRVTGLEMFVYKDDISVAGTAFAVDGTTRLIGSPVSNSFITEEVLQKGSTVTGSIKIYGEPFQAGYSPLMNQDGKIVGMLAAAKYEQDIISIANATNRLTLITVIIILLGLMIPVYMLVKRMVQGS
jgi:hypothetical protein